MGTTEPGTQRRIAHRHGPEDRTRRARRQHGVDRGPVAQAATDLHGNLHRGADGGHQLRLHRTAGARAVQVDDVQPARARRREAARHRHRVVAVDRLAIVGALQEADAAPAAQVDGGVDGHASPRPRTTPTKFSSRPSPTCWLFSGWNWQAKMLSRATLEANSGPYGVVVATTDGSAGTG